MAKAIKIIVKPTGGDRVHHVSERDIRVVLSRLPEEALQRVKGIYLNDLSWGTRVLGYTNGGRREIALCALPPKMSLTRFLVTGQAPEQFGATRGAQWPELAIRRYILYDVLLHEIGRLQIIDPGAKSEFRKYAREGKAQEFAMAWCKKMWASNFDHPDPVHHKPDTKELGILSG